MNGKTLYVVMPAYNESANIENVVHEWYPVLAHGDERSRMVIFDGGSTDDTLKILYGLRSRYPKLLAFSKPGTDHGTKVAALYQYAVEQGADWIFQTDSDGQTSPDEFPGFWRSAKTHDVILGNRVQRGDGIERKIVENVLRAYIKIFFGVMLPDANAPFRLMKSSVVQKYLGLLPDTFKLPNAVLAACFSRYHENVVYRKITFQPRQGGKNYMNLKRILCIGIESVYDFYTVRKNMQEYERALHKRGRMR